MPARGSKYAFVSEKTKPNKAEKISILRREKFGLGTIEDRLRNPEYYHHLGNPEQIPYDDYGGVWNENSVSKNMDVARPSKKHTNADQKTSAYVPRPGDNMPQAWHNHAQIKKPTLVMRFRKKHYQYNAWEPTKKWLPRFVWSENSQGTSWKIYESRWGYWKCEVWRSGKLVHKAYAKNPKDTVLAVLGQSWYFAKDAATNLPAFAIGVVSVYKAVHILLGENPKTPLPQKNVTESFSDSHMFGHFFWSVIERPTPKPKSLYGKGVSTGSSKDEHEPQAI